MRTVGEILKEERERKSHTLDEVERVTKIRKELLEALEADDYTKLPPATFIQGFIKNYGKFLNLDSEKLLAVFRREYSDSKHPPKILDSLITPVNSDKFHITPARLISGLVIFLVVAFFAYLWFEYRYLVGAPILEVISPQDQGVVIEELLEVAGTTTPEARVSINDQEVYVDTEGKFTQEIRLQDGMNKITIVSTSRLGANSRVERTVFLRIDKD